ncbi:MAG: hypothetical protein KKE17_08065 [Proteobacteria bacterium]|nr:hypothetical protein [Pseudomonadota bacterium]MBU1709942.1 hypothetical protein [Pseudomonadota bacterium]
MKIYRYWQLIFLCGMVFPWLILFIYAKGIFHRCPIITADADFDGIPEVIYFPKK